MEKIRGMMIEEFGARVVSVWEGLRPATRSLVERALGSPALPPATAATTSSSSGGQARATSTPYDARSEWELSRLLAALDERAVESGVAALSAEQTFKLARMVETCARVLQQQARSAEVFAQLLERALQAHDYARVDELADTLSTRLASSETCEMARHPNPAVRAIAQEALIHAPTSVLVELLGDPVDSETAREALERQAEEFESEEARWIVNALERADAVKDDI